MKESYQEEVYSLLPTQFTRKELIDLADSLNINLNSANSYLHCWTKRDLVKKISMGVYRKNSEKFIAGETKMIPIEVKTTPKPVEEPVEDDVVLNDLFVKTATDEELLRELVARGFEWALMQKTVVTRINFEDYKN